MMQAGKALMAVLSVAALSLPVSSAAAVGDPLLVANTGDVTMTFLGSNTSFADQLVAWTKFDLNPPSSGNLQDNVQISGQFTNSTPVGTVADLGSFPNTYPLLFVLTNLALHEQTGLGEFSNGIYRGPRPDSFGSGYFDFDLIHLPLDNADVRWLPGNVAQVGFPDTNGAAPANFADYAMRIQVTNVSPTIAAVPEPSIWALLLAGLGVVGFLRRRRAA